MQRLHSVWKIFHAFHESTQHLFWTPDMKDVMTLKGRSNRPPMTAGGPALRALRQGTLHRQEGKCPLCGEEFRAPWQCKFRQGRVTDLPAQWKQRLAASIEPELCNRAKKASGPHTHLAHMSVSRLIALPLQGVHEVSIYRRLYVSKNVHASTHYVGVN